MEYRIDLGDFVYGTWRILDESPVPSVSDLARRLETCAEVGINFIDTAEIYGLYRVEAFLGKVFREAPELKDRLGVVTKGGIDVPSEEKGARLPHYNASGANLVACAEKSLQLMGLDALDLYLVHRPDTLTHPEDTAKGLQRLLDSGKCRNVGVSNYTLHQFEELDRLMGGKLVTNQVEFSPLHMNPMEDGIVEQASAKGLRLMAWSPLGGGALFDQEDATESRLRACLDTMSADYEGAPPDVLVYAWILSHWSRPSVILGTGKEERIRAAVKASGLSLRREDWYAIWEAAKGHTVP